ncbi:DUF3078 domain-containing protein [Salisaeta longa]|uniref:DUF3078 domain-containing protein n=1 Tax=Salisaeta longa TaxID=503170 RepID=UPI0003B31888|nr:DUF3078 domain-containing protein [Salisaeta longa]
MTVRCALFLVAFLGWWWAGGGERAQAQDAAPTDTVDTWTTDVTGSLAGSQAAYRNWQQGGLNTIAFTASLDAKAQRQATHWSQTFEGRFALGFLRQEEQDPALRKADDLIRLRTKMQYRGEDFWRTFQPTIAAELRTQFASGFSYSENPFPDTSPLADANVPVKTSAFFAPAYITESLGLSYEPNDWFSTRLGVAAKQTYVGLRELRVLYGLDPSNTVLFEGGIESTTSVNKEIFENVRYQSTLGLFQTLNRQTPVDVTWENLVVMKVNSWLSTQLEFVAIYNKDTIDKLQIKEVLSLGVSFQLI